MRYRLTIAIVAALCGAGALLLGALGGVAAAAPATAGAIDLRRPAPSWYTADLHRRVLAAGAGGVQVSEERLNTECPGFQQEGVSAAGCIIEPFGCTANFIFTDGSSDYVGTARHCVGDKGGDVGRVVVMQVDTATIAAVGEVAKHTSGEGDVGEDFALVRIYPDVAEKWGINPAVPFTLGPQGVYEGCEIEPVEHYGHGYGVAVSQGKPYAGLATNWLRDGYGWTGAALPGDSGSPVVLADGRAAGNLTHLIVDLFDYPGSDVAGMRATAILQFLGGNIQLVNADGTASTAGAGCTHRPIRIFRGNRIDPTITPFPGEPGEGGGGGGGNEGGNGKGGGNGGGGDKGNKGGNGKNSTNKPSTTLL